MLCTASVERGIIVRRRSIVIMKERTELTVCLRSQEHWQIVICSRIATPTRQEVLLENIAQVRQT